MGDFWSGNIIITLNENGALKRIHVLDWELAKPGLSALDLGQFCAEMDLLRRFHPEYSEAAGKVISTLLETYSGVCQPEIGLARATAVHWGAHLVAWTPRIPWGGKEETRKVVEDGVELLIKGSSGADGWVKDSLVGSLCP